MPRERSSIEGRQQAESSSGGKIALLLVLGLIITIVVVMMSGNPAQQQAKRGDAIIAKSIDNLAGIEKESFTVQGEISTGLPQSYGDFRFSGEGRIDTVNERMSFNLNFESLKSVSLESYTIGDDIYVEFEGSWIKYSGLGMSWSNAQLSTKVLEFAQNFDTKVSDREEVNGQESYRIEASPTIGQILKLAQSISPGALEGTGLTNIDNLPTDIEDIDMIIWIATDSMLPVKTSIVINTKAKTIIPESSTVETSDMTISIDLNFDYTTPFNIVLPSAAQQATEL